ncbi:filamentous hemagglutinin N-terminal domain-containing protein, partial [Billgrantia endophytica]
MNRTYRIVWKVARGVWQAVGEHVRGTGKGRNGGRPARSPRLPIGGLLVAWSLSVALVPTALASGLPGGERIVGGAGGFDRHGNQLTIEQHSQNLAIEWRDFSIDEGHRVEFVQPNAQAAALNRVTGDRVSHVRGALSANGRVFLVNPNGVHFSATAQVDVGALVASTLDISTEDFMAGNHTFEGGSGNAVINAGNITTLEGGHVAMIAAEIINTGSIETPQGSMLMGAGSRVTLDLGGPVKIEVEEARLETYIGQGGAIRADGGLVYLTAKAANDLTASVINHTGITEARTLASGDNGEIMLMGDMSGGQVRVAGTLDASAPDGGDGGFIETSAARVRIADELAVTTLAADGRTGEWLIDPTDFTVGAGGAEETDSGIGADTLSASLGSTSITLQTVAEGDEAGDIHVNADVSWSADTILTLDAHGDININAAITATGGSAGLRLNHGGHSQNDGSVREGTGYHVNAPVTLSGEHAEFSVNGDTYTLIHDIQQLRDMSDDLAGRYALATDIGASETASWNGGLGWNPIGDLDNGFTGILEGLGHVISDLTIRRPSRNGVGLFGMTESSAVIRHLGLQDSRVEGYNRVGALVGNNRGMIERSHASGRVEGENRIGGLVGMNDGGTITRSYATGEVEGIYSRVGGLVGFNDRGEITRSYATGSVTGNENVGGLVGANFNGEIIQSYATGSVVGHSNIYIGGLVGVNWGGAVESGFYATTDADGNAINVGLNGIGYGNGNVAGRILHSLTRPETFAGWDMDGWSFDSDAGAAGYRV